MGNKFTILIFVFLLSLTPELKLYAWLNGYNLFETRYGIIPDLDTVNIVDIYNQTNLGFSYKNIRGNLKLEQFYVSQQQQDYVRISQYHLKYKYENFKLEAGTFSETLGRGLLFRTYEIKNSILEDRIYRIRKGFYNDILGASASYSNNIAELKLLAGKPLNNTFPPGDSLSRTDLVTAIEPSFNFHKQKVGFIALRNENSSSKSVYGSIIVKGSIIKSLSYYGEYARKLHTESLLPGSDNPGSYAAYAGIDISHKNLGISIELKDYKNFFLGSGFNNPPTLVKEHTYKTLNRSTHVSDLLNEKGIQTELYFLFSNNNLLTFNFAYAVNEIIKPLHFYEFFLEYTLSNNDNWKTALFADFSEDELYLEDNRVAVGIYTDRIFSRYSISLNSEVQNMKRNVSGTQDIWNLYENISLNIGAKYSISLFWEYSTDPNITDRAGTPEIENVRHFWGGEFFYKMNNKNSVTLFAGQRRGGPACSSGICYEVPDYEGITLRINSRF